MTHSTSIAPVLSVQNLRVQFSGRNGTATVVDDVSFSVAPGRILGLVGESGSGKSMTAYAIMGLIDPPGKVVNGKILFRDTDLLRLSPAQLRALRGNRVAMIFQDPMMTLNPVLRIDTQMIEAVQAHQDVSRATARAMSRDALARVGIAAPDERLQAYPHQFSGGMRQRVAIAIALLNKPDLIICDEPTTALDVTIQGQILHEMQGLCRETGAALIWITHDLAVVAALADDVCVMYGGRIVESGPVAEVLSDARHPYTHGLIASSPARNPRGQPLRQIPGAPPSALDAPAGCTFRPRCSRATTICETVPPDELHNGRTLRCFHPIGEDMPCNR